MDIISGIFDLLSKSFGLTLIAIGLLALMLAVGIKLPGLSTNNKTATLTLGVTLCIFGGFYMYNVAERFTVIPKAALERDKLEVNGDFTQNFIDLPLQNQTVESCKAECLNKPWCESFNFSRGRNECYLNNKKASEVDHLHCSYPKNNQYDYYERMW